MLTLRKTLLTSVLLSTFGLSTLSIANTCPTELKRDHEGYWYSDEKPGWKAHKKTPDGVTIKVADFGGVVYSPQRHRMACVYKASDGKWVALVSSPHNGILINKKATNDPGNGPAWEFSKQHKDYACGHPTVTDIKGCEFQLSD